ncbi:O-antigen ligase family protein [Amedibacillus sp. YH-ame10]
MEKLKIWCHQQLNTFTFDEKLILLGVASLYCHFVITILVLVGIVGYLIKEKRLGSIIKEIPRSKFVIAFCIITTLVALFYGNYLGFGCGIGILALFMFIFFYRSVATKRLFEVMLDICCVLSILCAIYGFIEYFVICQRLGHSVFELFIANSPKNRVHSMFFNANYYAMMLEFTILICLYKGMQWKSGKHTIFYSITVFLNLFALLLTGCRTAWVPFVVSVPVLILCCKMYKLFGLSLVGIAGAVTLVLMNPMLMKRASFIGKDFAKRGRIWSAAIKGIEAHPLFGEGPLTYYKIYPLYNGHPTQHAHNIFLDPILSHGVIPVLIVAVYFGNNLKDIYRLAKRKIDLPLFGLIVSFIITVILHGLLDLTVYWVQTGTLFLLIFSSASIYFRKNSVD